MLPSNAGGVPLHEYARQSATNEQWENAEAALRVLLSKDPGNIAAAVDLAELVARRGQLQQAIALLLEVARRLPRDVPLIVKIAARLIGLGEIIAARQCLALLSQAPDLPPEWLVSQARLRFSMGEIGLARQLMERALAAGIDSPGEIHLYAMLLQFDGQLDLAGKVLEQCLQRWPHFGDAMSVLVNLRRQTPQNNLLRDVEAQLQLLDKRGDDPDSRFVRAEFEHAKFKILDDLGRCDEAWAALCRCNALMHGLNPYDAAGESGVCQALMGLKAGEPPSAFEQPLGPTPIFIVGMPRSGTTLLDRMLSAHSSIASAGELVDFWRQLHVVADVAPDRCAGMLRIIARHAAIDYAELGRRYLRQTQWRAGDRAFYIDKLPANIQMVAFIRKALPHAKILHMTRDPMDVCYSNFKALFGNVSAYSYDLGALAHYYRQYSRIARHWRAEFPDTFIDVPYQQLVSAPESTLGRVLAHCGLALQDRCLHPETNGAPVATPSSAQVRQPIHTGNLGQWRRYGRQLESLRQALAAQGDID